MQYPGITDCIAVDAAVVCAIVDSQPCFFFRVYLKPEYEYAYEVRKLTSMSCQYRIKIQESFNNTVEELTVSNTAITKNNIEVKVIGTYQQPTQILSNYLIVRVADKNEAYLEQASPHSRPMAGHIGDVEANASYTKSFIFDEKMITCNYYEERLMCRLQNSYLQQMIQSKVNALPLTIGNHHLKLGAQAELKSTTVVSSPLVVHLAFQDYRIYLETYTVCPKITGTIGTPKGCFACGKMATLHTTAYSSCLPGEVGISFQDISISTRVIHLTENEKEYVIEFKTDKKCHQEKLFDWSYGGGM